MALVVLSGGGGDVAVSLAGTVAVAAQGLAVRYVFAWMSNVSCSGMLC